MKNKKINNFRIFSGHVQKITNMVKKDDKGPNDQQKTKKDEKSRKSTISHFCPEKHRKMPQKVKNDENGSPTDEKG
jgi:hypothetical protein